MVAARYVRHSCQFCFKGFSLPLKWKCFSVSVILAFNYKEKHYGKMNNVGFTVIIIIIINNIRIVK